jgi:hypothetical protein
MGKKGKREKEGENGVIMEGKRKGRQKNATAG